MKLPEQTVFIVDDDPAARRSLAALIESHGPRVTTFSSAEDLIERYIAPLEPHTELARSISSTAEHPDCIVCDLRMTGMSGVELQETLTQRGVIVPFIIVTAYGSVKTAVRAMQEGAVVFLEKPCPEEALWSSVLRALDWSELQKGALETRRRIARLTDSERAVLSRIVDGKANKEILRELGIGLRTVELRRATIMKAIGAHNIAELVRLVLEAEQIRPLSQRPHFDLSTAKDQRVSPGRPSKRVKR